MLYNKDLKDMMLGVLNDRISSITGCIEALIEEGYNPNQNKYTILQWSSMLIDAYENVDILDRIQQKKLDVVYNKVLTL